MGNLDIIRIIPLVFTLLGSFIGLVHAQPEKAIGRGAVVSIRGSTSSVRAFSSDLSQATALKRGFMLRKVAPGTFHVNLELPSLLSKAAQERVKPRAYARKENLCKRAKMRRLLASLKQRARCEPNWAYYASVTPNDPSYSQQYASSFLSLPDAWGSTTGNNNLIAIVIDSGVQYTHPDLAANMWTNPSEIASNGIDDDGNGYIDDVHGINAINGSGDPMDDDEHGTHCAGILGAQGNNGIGISGVAWNVKIAAAKFLDSEGSGFLSDAIESINYAISLKQAGNNIVVSNNSWGGGGYSASLYSAIQQSISAGILFVAAAGNSSNDNDQYPTYPASYNLSGVLSVASTNGSGERSYFSNYGATSVDIAAPGSNIYSCLPTNTYGLLSGTSMAAPQVAGIALLAQSACHGSLTTSQVKDAILNSGVTYAALSGLVSTGAIANAANAVTAASAICDAGPSPTNTPAATATPTSTETPVSSEPTATPEPDPTTPVPPTPTPSQGNGTGSPRRLTVSFNPDRKLRPSTPLLVKISGGGTSSTASLQLFGKDRQRRSYSCPEAQARLVNGTANISLMLPQGVRFFQSLTIVATTTRSNARDSASIFGSTKPRNYAFAKREFLQVCSILTKAIRR
jgi:subtilisin family serine protease